ncbi:MAG TPA: Type 1 glutamine amidotransferase-like domain-containing protein [Candidatus Limnocylindrales bacterium]|nr:Type 1 glutamine amidotransferase-like domain-containing protein [Candidatus Limnocylindrales bacterium]
MPKLYLLGGENVHKRSAREVNEKAFQDAGESLSVAVFPWARASFDRRYWRRKMLTDYFVSLGAGAVDFIEYSDSQVTIAQKVASSNLIYLTGGLVNALVERLRKMSVDSLLRDYDGVIVGRSAGALALCKKCVITCRDNQKARLVEGLGLADLTLKAHYKPRKDRTLQLLSKGGTIYAVPSRSAIVYEDGVYSFIGNTYVFENGKKCRL